jgi:hypothetical protein
MIDLLALLFTSGVLRIGIDIQPNPTRLPIEELKFGSRPRCYNPAEWMHGPVKVSRQPKPRTNNDTVL